MIDIEQLARELAAKNNSSTSLLVQNKTRKALANIKRARTLLEKAETTLAWAKAYKPPGL